MFLGSDPKLLHMSVCRTQCYSRVMAKTRANNLSPQKRKVYVGEPGVCDMNVTMLGWVKIAFSPHAENYLLHDCATRKFKVL